MTITNLTVGQRKIAAAQKPDADRYWRKLLQGANAGTFRPDAPGVARIYTCETMLTLPLGPELTARLKAGSRDDARALNLVLTALVAALLRAYTGEDDVLLGNPALAGSRLTDCLPLRLPLQATDSLRSLLARANQIASETLPHADFPVELIGPEPAVWVALAALHGADALAASGADVGFSFGEDAGGLTLTVLADAGRYSAPTAQRLGQHLIRLLEQATAQPAVALTELDLRLDSDKALHASVNATDHPLTLTSLTRLFAQTFARCADQTAVLTADARYSYAELDAASNQVAYRLLQAGIGEGGIVGILAARSFEMLAAIIGTLKAGAAYLPIDPSLPPARVAYLFEDSRASLVLVQPALRHLVPTGTKVIELTAEGAPAVDLPDVAPTAVAYVIYTSGSTGKPKGVVVEHLSVVNRIQWMQRAYPIAAGDVVLQKTPISFDVSVWELFWWLLEGATVSLLEPGGEREPAAVVAAIERHRVTTMHFVPTMLGAFAEYVALTGAADRLGSLRWVFASGEALGLHQVKAFAGLLKQARLVNLYGPTEVTVDVSHHPTSVLDQLVPIGKPIDNIRLHVLDRDLRPRPVGMVGELYIGGVGVARGYLHRPELTAERFVPGDAVGEARLYKTGDLVRWLADGSLEYLGRNDFQVKLRGFRIELGEIEHRLRSHPTVADAAVIVRQSEDGLQHLLAYVITKAEVGEPALLAHVGEMLPSYMVPERVTQMAEFPLSPNGKFDHRALPEPTQARAEYVAPRNEAEAALAGIWAEVLGLEQVGVTESFFSLGGNSIHFVSVLAKARNHGQNFTFQQLFQYPTIEQLVAHANDTAAGDAPPREYGPFELISEADRAKMPLGIEDAYPMSMLQSGLIYQSEIMHGNTSYHDIVSYLIQGSIDVELFRQAVRMLVRQNPVFRTSYHLKEFSEYLQLVHAEIDELPLMVEDVRHVVGEAAQQAWYEQWFHAEQNRSFDWEKPGLVRLHIHILSDTQYRYSISQHNSALDGWSMNQVHTKLFALYYALLRGESFPMEPVENHLRNFIGLEQYAIKSEAHIRFWRETMANRPDTRIPRLRPAYPRQGIEVVFQDIDLPHGLSDRLIALAQQLGVPVKNVLLAAHLKVHAFLCADDDVLTGYEHGGRPELPGADWALGVFLNSMPLRVKIADGTWADLIRQTYRTEAEILPYRRYPMARVKQDLRTTNGLFETVFNFTHFYSLKELKKLPEFALLDVRAAAITEFPLRMEFSQHFYTDEVQMSLHYHTAEFDREHIERIGGYLVQILQRMVNEPLVSHNTHSLLGEAEREQVAGFGRARGGVLVTDRYGNLVPVGTWGEIVAADADATSRRGRWLVDGSLEEEAAARPAPAEPVAPVVEVAPAAAPATLPASLHRVAAVWEQVLKLPVEQFQPDDDFFEIGGNSLAALRVVMLLDGAVSLRDVMCHSRLHELAAVIGQKGAVDDSLLLALTPQTESARASVVCLPYAGGNAVHFGPFAEALAARVPGLAVFAAELPGHDPEAGDAALQDFAMTAKRLADEIQRTMRGKIVLWGHCIGSALALELARLLGERDMAVKHLFLAAKLLYGAEEIRQTIRNAEALSFDDIHSLYAQWSGDDGLARLDGRFQDFLVRVFRHDSIEANRYLLARCEAGSATPLTVPCSLVVADDDPATIGYREGFAAWRQLVAELELLEIAGGGHYFLRSRAAEAASLVARTVFDKEEGL